MIWLSARYTWLITFDFIFRKFVKPVTHPDYTLLCLCIFLKIVTRIDPHSSQHRLTVFDGHVFLWNALFPYMSLKIRIGVTNIDSTIDTRTLVPICLYARNFFPKNSFHGILLLSLNPLHKRVHDTQNSWTLWTFFHINSILYNRIAKPTQ